MPRFCSSCGVPIAENAAVCPSCQNAVYVVGGAGASPVPAQTAGGLADNVAGALAYITIIPAIVFLVTAPYNQNRFVKFHCLQCVFLCATSVALSIGVPIFGGLLATVSGSLALLLLPVNFVLGLGILIAWIMCVIKAYGNQAFKLPIIGEIAARQAGM